jgi:4,5-DOPA dioxygenase extradiol
MKKKMPVLFIGHGSPLNIVLENSYTRSLAAVEKSLPKPKGIMVVSAHWLTNGTFVACMKKPRTIYDFYGFPKELYDMSYPSPGAPDEVEFVTKAVLKTAVQCNLNWGLDHASWAVLKHINPQADIPVFEMSLDYTFNEWHPKPVQYHYDLASELSDLRNRGILIIGSGNIVLDILPGLKAEDSRIRLCSY